MRKGVNTWEKAYKAWQKINIDLEWENDLNDADDGGRKGDSV